MRRSKLPNLTDRNQYLIYDDHEVIFRLVNYISSHIQKLHGKMKQKLALLFSCYITASRLTLI